MKNEAGIDGIKYNNNSLIYSYFVNISNRQTKTL